MELQIKRIMQEKEIAAAYLAEQMGATTQYIYQIVNGKNGATIAQYERISEILGVHLWQLFAPKEEYVTIDEHHRILDEITKKAEVEERPDMILIDRETGDIRKYKQQI